MSKQLCQTLVEEHWTKQKTFAVFPFSVSLSASSANNLFRRVAKMADFSKSAAVYG